jgi:epsilon-lactone hydrolase
LVSLSVALTLTAHAADLQPRPATRIDDAGTVHTTAFDVPLSSYMSDQAKQAFIQGHSLPNVDWRTLSLPEIRALSESALKKFVDRARILYPVRIRDDSFAAVSAKVITPQTGVSAANRHRVLINVHGGGFFGGAGNEALVESIPVAGLGKFRVITIDYREGPEYKFPAASEDTAAVYRELLKEYRPRDIGIYGCSAGGVLSAMAVAWFQEHRLPTPGAIGIFGAGAFGSFYGAPDTPGTWGGDSRFTAPPLVGEEPLPIDYKQAPSMPAYASAYLSDADLQDPLVSPALWPWILKKFPPTLIISGTRAHDMSAAVQTQRVLTSAGVSADLHLWDGMGHCFFFDVDLPESQEALDVIVKFFNTRLGRAEKNGH